MVNEEYQGVDGLISLMHRLRQECEWDKAQTHESLVQYFIEECFEVVDAIETSDDQELKEELGDVLLQVVFHSEIASQNGLFTINDVADTVIDKMIQRHPEVFAGAPKKYSSLEERERQWQQDKRAEKAERRGPYDGIPASLPALFQATKMIDRAQKLDATLPEADDSLGAQLFTMVLSMHQQGHDPEAELRSYLRQVRNS
ncbi:MAG: MazG family protein [Micrococcaceae bacterium]